MKLNIKVTPKQREFIKAAEDEVLFGGGAGGGKSMGQMIDAFVYAVKYPKSRQLILRRTLPELEKTLIRYGSQLYPNSIYKYSPSTHVGRFANGSVLEFSYCDSEEDVHRYQSAEYDVIRFDELTHFTEYMYLYLYSRLRGSNGYPKQMKSTTNPGGPGHYFVKRRFIDGGEPGTVQTVETGTRRFIPALVGDNTFLTKADPMYARRLLNLPEGERRALLWGQWELCEGRFFSEWREEIHTEEPRPLSQDSDIYISIDYGLDMFAACFFEVREDRVFLYKELYKSDLIISEAARLLLCHLDRQPGAIYAPPDLWNRRQDSGISAAQIFEKNGVTLTKVSAARESGWLAVKELLCCNRGRPTLTVSRRCPNTVRCMGAIMTSRTNAGDTANTPHELTHLPDAVRYFAVSPRGREVCNPDPQIELLVGYGLN